MKDIPTQNPVVNDCPLVTAPECQVNGGKWALNAVALIWPYFSG
jgi:hypothetical protein